MSGGSFNYASNVFDLSGLVDKLPCLTELADTLHQHAPHSKAAKDTLLLLSLIRELDTTISENIGALQQVWHALEWWYSSDYSERQFHDAVDRDDKERQ